MLLLDRRLLALAGRLRGPIGLIVLLGLAGTAAYLTQALLVAHALAHVLEGGSLPSVAALLVAAVGVVLARGVLLWLREVAAQGAGAEVKRRIRDRLFARILLLGPAWTQRTRTGRLQSVLVDGVEGLEGYFARYLPQVLIALASAAGILGYLMTIDVMVAAGIGTAVLLVPVLPRLWDRALGERGNSHWDAYERVNSDYVDAMQGMTTLKAFNAAAGRRRELEGATWRLYRATMAQLALSLVGSGLTALLVSAGIAAGIGMAVVRMAGGHLSTVELLVVLLLAGECFRPFAALATYWHMSYLGFSAIGDVSEILRARPGVEEPAEPVPPPAQRPVHLALRGVTFRYPGSEVPALDGVDLAVAAGETVALVGPSGAGKTTIALLLLRLYDPDAGTVELGHVELRRLSPANVRSMIAVVPQDPYLFAGTAADNLRLGRPEATDQQVEAAARAAGIHDHIMGLPGQYQSVLGERGLTLSGGQRQRIAIARAFLMDAPVLILDEATSAVDGEREADIQHALRRLTEGRTVLVIAHRLSTVRGADRIVVISGGRVVEHGDHHGLLAAGGSYARLVAAQAGQGW